MNKAIFLVVLTASIFLQGCIPMIAGMYIADNNKDSYKVVRDSYIGQPSMKLVAEQGQPEKRIPLAEGGEKIYYDAKDRHCETLYTVRPDGVIESVISQGCGGFNL